MHKAALSALMLVSCAAQAQGSIAMNEPVASMDMFRGIIQYLGNATNGTRMCLSSGDSVGTVRPVVEAELQRLGVQGLPTPNQVLVALSTRYPCPFSPYALPELRPAEQADLEGTWLMPEASMKLFLPPKSPSWQQERLMPMRCEGVSFLPEGESRTVEVRGRNIACPESAAELAVPAGLPRVVTWAMPSRGRVVLTRTDLPGHVEEWEAFAVTAPFEFAGVSFQPGDVVEYARKHPGISQPFAYRFRHLRRLP